MTTPQRAPFSVTARQVAVRIRNLRKTFDQHEAFSIGNRVKLIIPAQSVVPLHD